MCRSRRELSNAYLLAKIGVDTAENEPLEVWGENSIHYSLHSLAARRRAHVELCRGEAVPHRDHFARRAQGVLSQTIPTLCSKLSCPTTIIILKSRTALTHLLPIVLLPSCCSLRQGRACIQPRHDSGGSVLGRLTPSQLLPILHKKNWARKARTVGTGIPSRSAATISRYLPTT